MAEVGKVGEKSLEMRSRNERAGQDVQVEIRVNQDFGRT